MVSKISIKLADRDPDLPSYFTEKLDLNFEPLVEQIRSVDELRATTSSPGPQIVLLGLDFCPESDITQLIHHSKAFSPSTLIIPIIPRDQKHLIKKMLDLQLYHYLLKPFEALETSVALRRACDSFKTVRKEPGNHSSSTENFEGMIGRTEVMHQLFDIVSRVAEDDMSTVLIRGESGTGKEMVAKAIHARSGRNGNNFVPVNCAAIPDDLLESELFGYTRGAFTGAISNKQGRIQYAHKGTLFLDEIGDMKASLQAKLLRVLQEKEFEPVGSLQSIPVDTRIVAATHCDLETLVSEGKFREDLYYRLSVVPIVIPALKERAGDIPLLINAFLKKYTENRGRERFEFSPRAYAVLSCYEWRGNVRELENLIQHMSILYSGKVVHAEDLPEKFHGVEVPPDSEILHRFPVEEHPAIQTRQTSLIPGDPWEAGRVDFNELINDFETELIIKALQKTGGNKKEAASLLNLKRTTLLEKIKKKEIHGTWEQFNAVEKKQAESGG